MSARVPLPSSIRFRPFAVSAAAALGVSAKRLRGSDLEAPHRGVRVRSESLHTLLDDAAAYATIMPPYAFYSHVTAARLLGIPLPYRLERRHGLDVAVPAGQSVPVGQRIRGHRLSIDPMDVAALGTVRVTSLARTWCDLAGLLTEEELIAAGDFLLWRRRAKPLQHLDLSETLERFHGRRGRRMLDEAEARLTDRSDSPAESKMQVRFRHAGFPEPEVNLEIYDDSGYFVAMADLSFPKYRVAFDYEGDLHRSDAVQWGKDLKRAPRFEDANWSYIRAGPHDLADSTEILDLVRRRLRARGWNET